MSENIKIKNTNMKLNEESLLINLLKISFHFRVFFYCHWNPVLKTELTESKTIHASSTSTLV